MHLIYERLGQIDVLQIHKTTVEVLRSPALGERWTTRALATS